MKTHNFISVAGDTDGIAFKKPDETPFTPEERTALIAELNSLMDPLIRWEDDGIFQKQIVVKAKNYILQDEKGKVKVKGSALKATTKEKALQRFVQNIIALLLVDRADDVERTYFEYAREAMDLRDISQWCSKHTVTKAVLTGKGTAQVRLREALKGKKVQEGDKFYTFFRTPDERCLLENFDGRYDVSTLLGKLYDTLCVFETVIDVSKFPNLTLKKNKSILEGLSNAYIGLQMQKPEVFKGV